MIFKKNVKKMGQKFDLMGYASFYCSTVHQHFFMNIIDQSFIFKKKYCL